MTQAQQQLNIFLVQVFGDILRREQAMLSKGPCRGLSLAEVHVLEAIDVVAKQEPATMATVAANLGVTCGTLTVAVKTLEQKGFVRRERCEQDRRRVSVTLTSKSHAPLKAHAAFHADMVQQAARSLSPQELETLAAALQRLHTFFKSEASV